VIYQGRSCNQAALLPAAPKVIPFASRQLWHAVEGACDSAAQPGPLNQTELWVRVIHHTVTRSLSASLHGASPLERLWAAVNADLARGWTLEEIARIAGMSKENLRRICLRDAGASPMRQLTKLRIVRASELLAFTSDKLSSIAERIGYSDPFAFSVAFKRETGLSPSDYRTKSPR